MKKFLLFIVVITAFNISYSQNTEWKHYYYDEGDISAIAEEGDYLWIGTRKGGLIKMHKTTEAKEFYTVCDNKSIGIVSGAGISSIAVDKNGNKWISNYDNLIKFDNKEWTVYSRNDDLGLNYFIEKVAVDNHNNIWIGTNCQVAKLYEDNVTVYSEENIFDFGASWGLKVDSKNNIWAVNAECLAKFDGEKWINITDSMPVRYHHFHDIAIDKDDNIWIGNLNSSCRRGILVKYDGKSFIDYNDSIPCFPENPGINAIAVENNGTVWMGTYDELLKYNTEICELYPNEDYKISVHKIFLDSEENKWVAYQKTYLNNSQTRHHLIKIEGEDWHYIDLKNSELKNNHIVSIAIDTKNNKWITHDNISSGLIKFDGKEWTTYNVDENIIQTYANITTMTIDNNDKWIGTNKGLLKFDDNTWTKYDTENSGLAGDNIRSIKTESGIKWIATNNGLAKFDDNHWQVYNTDNSQLPSNDIYSILITPDGTKWISTSEAIIKYYNEKWEVFHSEDFKLSSNNKREMGIDSQGVLWITGFNKFFKFKDGTFTSFTIDSLSGYINSIAIDNEDNKWIGCSHYIISPLIKLDKDENVTYNSLDYDISVPSVYSIAIDKNNNKWIGTHGAYSYGYGLFVYNETGIINNIEPISPDNTISTIQLFPNPANTTISIEVKDNSRIQNIEILDLKGQCIHTEGKNDSNNIDISTLPTGVYFVRICTDRGIETKKFIKN